MEIHGTYLQSFLFCFSSYILLLQFDLLKKYKETIILDPDTIKYFKLIKLFYPSYELLQASYVVY